MCGVIGYVGRRAAKERLLRGLERLEYRGYDSSGICLSGSDGLDSIKAVGKLENLKLKAAGHASEATIGIGHTRWATHGRVTEENAHPLTAGEDRSVAIVLNGIIENYAEIKQALIAEGARFSSETDAEVVAHLVKRFYSGDLVEAVRATYARLTGHFAFIATHRDHPDLLVGTRHQCPLIAGVADGETFLASSITAFSAETRRVKYIEDGEIVVATPDCGRHPRRPRRALPARRRRRPVGRRDRAEGRLRQLHAQGDPRAAARRRRDDRAQPARRRPRSRARRRLRARRRAARPDPRLRHGAQRRAGRGLPDRGMGGPALRRRDRERMALPPAAARRGHARRRDLTVGRDRRHARRPAAGAPVRRTDDGDHELAGVADHARGRRRPLHARRDRDRRRRDQDLHVPARAAVPVRAAPRGGARDARRRRARRADGRAALAAAEDHQHARAPGRRRRVSPSATTTSRISSSSGAT